jgi:hypothetical protein
MADCNCTTTETEPPCTLCDGDKTNNVWMAGSICLLDTMTEADVTYVIQRDHRARVDLRRITTNERLIELANTVPPLPSESEGDRLQREFAGPAPAFYAIFRGQPPFAQ